MADKKFSPTDAGYIEVKDRIVAFYEKHPQGSLQSEIVEFGENIVVMKAYAYRTPDDTRPGIGHSQMPLPGKTTFTRDSEIENAETSAWGRAIAALGFEVKRSIASADEVEMKKGPAEARIEGDFVGEVPSVSPVKGEAPSTPGQRVRLMTIGKKLFGDTEGVRAFVYREVNKRKATDLTRADMDHLFAKMEEIEALLADGEAAALEPSEVE